MGERSITVPYWLAFLLLSAFPVHCICRIRKKKLKPGYCNVCGYDMRATPERCSECGEIAPPPRRRAVAAKIRGLISPQITRMRG